MEIDMPEYIFKYKSLSSIQDICRFIDLIDNHRIYMPLYSELNDPLEGQVVDISIPGYAGIGNYHLADVEDPVIAEHKEKYRILSLALRPDNAQLWAHYANGYQGLCLCFSTDGAFGKAKEIEYCKQRDEVFAETERALMREVRKSFLKKESGWGVRTGVACNQEVGESFLTFQKRRIKGNYNRT